jgi:hypothetical protein
MLKDVYAGDVSPGTDPPPTLASTVLRVEADADPDAFQRMTNPLILADRAPLRITLVQHKRADVAVLSLTVYLPPIPLPTVQSIVRQLARLTCVRHVAFQAIQGTSAEVFSWSTAEIAAPSATPSTALAPAMTRRPSCKPPCARPCFGVSH